MNTLITLIEIVAIWVLMALALGLIIGPILKRRRRGVR